MVRSSLLVIEADPRSFLFLLKRTPPDLTVPGLSGLSVDDCFILCVDWLDSALTQS